MDRYGLFAEQALLKVIPIKLIKNGLEQRSVRWLFQKSCGFEN
jgi:hypothetical protein